MDLPLQRTFSDPKPSPSVDADRSLGHRLVERWQSAANRDEAFRQIFETYYRPVYAFFLRRGFPSEECYDLAQDTFLRVSRGLESFRRESSFESWLFKVAANIYRNTLRGQAALKREADEVSLDEMTEQAAGGGREPAPALSSGDPNALDGMLAEERQRILRSALDALPAQMRRCVLLRIDRDLKYREIAELMTVSIDTVKAHLYQARQQLKLKLGDYFGDLDF